MIAGSCYRLRLDHSEPTPHLWIVLLEPTASDEQTVLVSLTTLRHNCDQTVVIMPGDHPFVNRPSCIFFADSRIISYAQLNLWAEAGIAQQQPMVSTPLLQEICSGLRSSPYTPKKIVKFYESVIALVRKQQA